MCFASRRIVINYLNRVALDIRGSFRCSTPDNSGGSSSSAGPTQPAGA